MKTELLSKETRKILITQSNYIPWKGYFDLINEADLFIVYDDMQYTKRDWRNRNLVKTAHGTQWITIPVNVKGRYYQKINETFVTDQTWVKNHLSTIKHCYSKSAYFDYFFPLLEGTYLQLNTNNLSEINISLMHFICDHLGIETPFLSSSEFSIIGDRSEKLLNICLKAGATEYLSGPAAMGYLDVEMFQRNGINVTFYNYGGYREYTQLHGDFEHGVTILDLIFNEGPNAINFMKSFTR